MIFYPYANLVDSYYFYTLPHSPLYFNYDPYVNSMKTLSNIILVQNQPAFKEKIFQESKISQNPADESASVENKMTPIEFPKQRLEKQKKIAKQISVKKKKRITKSAKKVDMIQKQGRNSHSNILRKFFKLLSLQSQFTPIIEKIIERNGFQMKVADYLAQMSACNIDHRNYIRIKEIQQLFIAKKSPINTITRILFQYYLKSYYVEHLLSSKKTDSKSIIFHLKGIRTIREEILLGNGKEHCGISDQN